MEMALKQAVKAFKLDEVPIGAVVIRNNIVVGRGYNQRETLKDPTAHAEMIAITAAANTKGDWRLDDCVLYVTKEPCPMCAGAAWASRVGHVIWGAPNDDAGAMGSLYNLAVDPRLNYEYPVTAGVRPGECGKLLVDFFANRR